MKPEPRSNNTSNTAKPTNSTTERKRNTSNDKEIPVVPRDNSHHFSSDDKNKSERTRRIRKINNPAQIDAAATIMDEGTASLTKQSFSTNRMRQQRRKSQFEELHQEMELVSYTTTETGQPRRILPRRLSSQRTSKRKLLEKQDQTNDDAVVNESNHGTSNQRKIRGAKAASEDRVVEASLIFGAKSTLNDEDVDDEGSAASDDDDDNDSSSIEEEIEEVDYEDDDDAGEEEADKDSVDGEDNALDPVDDEKDASYEIDLNDISTETDTTSKVKRNSSAPFPSLKRKKSTRLQRLKNFKSMRMAERHGAALGAHVQGKPNVAIKKLKQIAARVPLAPQIYSSLGLVYEDLFMESQRESVQAMNDTQSNGTITGIQSCETDVDQNELANLALADDKENDQRNRNDSRVQDIALRNQLNLAKKTYGSYHVAAVLYKRDYSLWVRAADSAYEIAMVHTTIMQLSDIASDVVDYHRSEKKHWLNEARNDYQVADKLNPPGIEIQAKLAHVMIELGMLSEALTLLTEIKNRVEFDTSYRAWLLFADLMLRIGHECSQWNAGIHINDNNMFRRWLRKWSMTFDWKERRMQALLKSLEAACGSVCSAELIKWMKNRVDATTGEKSIQALDSDNLNDSEKLLESTDEATNFDFSSKPLLKSRTSQNQSISASCQTVFAIASELMRHMLEMHLFAGGKLVGETVSLYLKDRQKLCESRRRKKAEFDSSQQQSTSLFAMQPEAYDVESNSDDDTRLSDDEVWDDDSLTPSLRKGKLPPDLLFLYGLCLIGEGESERLACTCISSLRSLPCETSLYLKEPVVDVGVVPSIPWMIFREARTRTNGVLTALSIVTDVVQYCSVETKLSHYLWPLFSQHIKKFTDEGWLDLIKNFDMQDNEIAIHRQNLFIKVLVAAMRYELNVMEQQDKFDAFISVRRPVLISQLAKVISASWRVYSDGAIDQNNVDALEMVYRLVKIKNDHLRGVQITSQDGSMLHHLLSIMSTICRVDSFKIPDLIIPQSVEISEHPMGSKWLSKDLENISRRVFNLCVGINVSNRSGWLNHGFLINPRFIGSNTFYGITTDEGPISGYIPEFVEEEIKKAWEGIQVLHCNNIAFDFCGELRATRNSTWYNENRAQYLSISKQYSVINYGEDKALFILLYLASACLTNFELASERQQLNLLSLSILLPVTQFTLKRKIWDADIGIRAVSDTSEANEWPDTSKFAVNNGDNKILTSLNRPVYVRPSRSHTPARSGAGEGKALNEWFHWENEHLPRTNMFDVSIPVLLQAWLRVRDLVDVDQTSQLSKIMQEIDDYMKKLRSCFSVQAAERTSIQVARILLRLLEYSDCQNPFIVIQLAAMFASQGSKSGTTDHFFRAKLPKPEECTLVEALLILGRAECLNAIQLGPEAAFLCNFIANVGRINCPSDISSTSVDRRWLVLSVLAYNLSVSIRIMEHSLFRHFGKRENVMGIWSDTTIDWFHHLRRIRNLSETLLDNVDGDVHAGSDTMKPGKVDGVYEIEAVEV